VAHEHTTEEDRDHYEGPYRASDERLLFLLELRLLLGLAGLMNG
jgi:hypothetical protein